MPNFNNPTGSLTPDTAKREIVETLTALDVPIIDTIWAVVRRTARGDAFFVADRGHIHHQLLRLGFSQRDAMLILTAVSAGLAMVAVLLGRLARG